MKKRVAFVRLRYLPPSETFIYEELKNIKKYKPFVYTRKKMNVRRFPYRYVKRLPKSTKKIMRAWKRDRIRLIHARFGKAGVEVMKAKKRLKLPMLTSFHGYDLPTKVDRTDKYQRKLPALFRMGNHFTVPSQQMRRVLIRRGCPSKKITVHYSGIDLSKFSYVKRKQKIKRIRILTVARLHEKKGLSYLIKAFKKVLKSHPDSRLTIVGEGPERSKLKSLIRSLKLKKYIQLKGDLPHRKVAKEMRKADIFCLPSVTTKEGNQEGIPNALKEAMATGLPVVTTKHGGIPELVTNKKEGLLVRERDVKALARSMRKLIRKPTLRIQLGKKGRNKVKRLFNSRKQVRRLQAIYSKLMRGKSNG